MFKSLALAAVALVAIPCSQAEARVRFSFSAEARSSYAHNVYYDEARDEEARIYQRPIGGREDHYWYDYRINVIEAQKELDSDLARADDDGDVRDAWREYAAQLRAERKHYSDAMRSRGLLSVGVYVGD